MVESTTPEEGLIAAQKAVQVMSEAFKQERITPAYLARKLKAELNAKETKAFKATVRKYETDHYGRRYVSEEHDEVIYSSPMVAWDVRQKARMDAHKLLGHYPDEKAKAQIEGCLTLKWETPGNGHDHNSL